MMTAAPLPPAPHTPHPDPQTPNPKPVPLDLAGRRVHFVGIGGCGMSGLARIAQGHGAVCSGSDQNESDTTRGLMRNGIVVTFEQAAGSVPAGCELLVISAAIRPDHPEVTEARRRGVGVMKYAQLLGRLMLGRTGVAIAGTHGKSSTTSMLSHVLIRAGLDPSLIVGANCAQIGGGSRVGGGGAVADGRWRMADGSDPQSPTPDILVAEACEYDRSFHNFHPTLAAILNVEADHMDVYSSLDEIVEAFAVFARKVPPAARGGYLLINHEMAARLAITAGLDCAVETIGFAYQADWRVGMKDGLARLHHGDKAVMDWKTPLPGEHMAYNAAVAAVIAHRLGATWDQIAPALESFAGLDRRMQVVGRPCGFSRMVEDGEERRAKSEEGENEERRAKSEERDGGEGGDAGDPTESLVDSLICRLDTPTPNPQTPNPAPITVIDDYGHHPTEVDTTLRALRQHYRPARLICVFQPHQHSRTRFLMQQFAASFSQADIVIVPDIYFVRDSEAERQAVTAADLVGRLRRQGVTAMHLSPFDAIVEHLRVITRPGDLVVTMGAGDVWKVAHAFVAAEER